MASFFSKILPFASGGLFSKRGQQFLTGTPEKHKRKPTLLPQQMPLAEQLWQAGLGPGAGGAFGSAADFYRDLLSDDSATAQMFMEPELRRYREQIIPDLSEQFAGMGSGGLSSSGFRNAAVSSGTDLSERLAAIRANLRMQGAAGLSSIGQAGLSNFSQDVMTRPGTEGFASQIAPAAGTAIGSAIGGPIGGMIGGGLGGTFGNWFSSSAKGTSSPYGGQMNRPTQPGQGFQLPNFQFR